MFPGRADLQAWRKQAFEQMDMAEKLMTKEKLVILLIFVMLVASAAAISLLRANGTPPVKATGAPPLKPSTAGEFRGISLQLHNGREDHPYETYIDQIAQTGANTISIVVTGYQENGASTCIFIDIRKTPTDKRLKKLIAYAHGKSLRVALMPIVLLEKAREGEWRGKIAPTSWDDWWADYSDYILRYARIAAQTRAEIFIIGSELVSTESQADRWRSLIAAVRDVYKGRLCYSANWDHYRPIEWWDALDIIGMTTYYDLTGGAEPTVERLLEAWKPIKNDILEWQAKINRPIMFTEVGWPNQETAAQYPWDYYRNPDSPDPQAQANCFEAFFRTWISEKAVAGFLVWEWQNDPGQKTGPQDPSYVPVGKPALRIIRKYYQMPSPSQAAGQPATAPATIQVASPEGR